MSDNKFNMGDKSYQTFLDSDLKNYKGKNMKRECDHCDVDFPVTKESLKKEGAFKLGEIVKSKGIGSYKYNSHLFKKDERVYTQTIKTFECLKNLYNTFFVCPICEAKNYVKFHHKPLNPDEAEWKLINVSYKIETESI